MNELADYMWAIELATHLQSDGTRFTGYTATCPVCSEHVRLTEHHVPILTSAGTRRVWQGAHVEAHRRSCFEEAKARRAAHLDEHPIDLWAS